jgi:hypothetical protein
MKATAEVAMRVAVFAFVVVDVVWVLQDVLQRLQEVLQALQEVIRVGAGGCTVLLYIKGYILIKI